MLPIPPPSHSRQLWSSLYADLPLAQLTIWSTSFTVVETVGKPSLLEPLGRGERHNLRPGPAKHDLAGPFGKHMPPPLLPRALSYSAAMGRAAIKTREHAGGPQGMAGKLSPSRGCE